MHPLQAPGAGSRGDSSMIVGKSRFSGTLVLIVSKLEQRCAMKTKQYSEGEHYDGNAANIDEPWDLDANATNSTKFYKKQGNGRGKPGYADPVFLAAKKMDDKKKKQIMMEWLKTEGKAPNMDYADYQRFLEYAVKHHEDQAS